jgi:predicted ferric reductase
MSTLPVTPQTTSKSSAFGVATMLFLFLGAALGILAASMLMPDRGIQLAASLAGSTPKAYWYMSRGSAFVALGLLWMSMMFGLLITDKMARMWPGAPTAFALHEFVSLLGLAFAMFHALILLGDHYINYTLGQILMPFGSVNYHPTWVGLGQIGFYTWAVISATFYIRQWIGSKTWKFIHYISFFSFVIAMLHGLASGTDTSMPWAQAVYWSLGGSVLFLTVYRVVAGLVPVKPQARRMPPSPVQQARQ